MVEERSAGKAGLVVGGAAAVMAAIALAKTRVAQAAPGDQNAMNEALLEILAAMAGTNADILAAVQRIFIPSGDGGDGGGVLNLRVQGFPPNTERIISTRVFIENLNTPFQLPDIIVPDDMELQIKAWPTNGGLIYVGESRVAATNVNQVWPLLGNEAIGYRIQNAEEIFISGTIVGNSAVVTVEQRR